MFSTTCPSCGAPLSFRSAASAVAVCGFCKSTVSRKAEQLELLGKQAELVEDISKIQIGTEGEFRGQRFSVIGRIQMRYDQGIWNEWYILYVTGVTSWLSDSSGQYAILSSLGTPQGLPSFEQLQVGQVTRFSNKGFTVTDRRVSQCIAAQGELPFSVDSRWESKTIDLRSGTEFLTLDFSDAPPVLYQGTSIEFDELKLVRLRDLKDRFTNEHTLSKIDPKQIQSLGCTSCGSPIKWVPESTSDVTCQQCGSQLKAQAGSLVLALESANSRRVMTALEPGDVGSIHGFEWTVLGVMQKQVTNDGSSRWEEYLLYESSQGYRWLSHAEGRWVWIQVLNKQPESDGSAGFRVDDQRFTAYENYGAETLYVAGAFNWQARVGDRVQVFEYHGGSKILTRERSDTEETWSVGQVMSAHQLMLAFGRGAGQKKGNPNSQRQAYTADDESGSSWLIGYSIAASALLLLLTLPAWFISRVDSPIEALMFGLIAVWLPSMMANRNEED